MATTPAQDWSAVATAWEAEVEEVHDATGPADEAMLRRLEVQRGDRVLELAAGPGELGRTWAELVGPDGSVVLSDLAEGMVDAARRRTSGLPTVEVARIDAAAIDRADGSFDVVACRMGLMFTPDPSVALGEVRRVLAPGGRAAALVWGALEHNPWMTCVGMAAMAHGVVAGGPPTGPGGIFSLSDPAHLVALAEGAGLADVDVEAVDVEFRAASVDEHVARVSSLAGPLAAAFAAASDDQLAAVRGTAAELAAPHTTDDGLVLPGRALLVSGHA